MRRRRGRPAVAIVGAGVSIAATGNAPVASWSGLLEDGVAHCEGLLGPSLPAGWAQRRRAQLASGDTEELISAAEAITRRLGGPGGGAYLRWLEQSVGPLTATRPEVLDALPASAEAMRKAWRPPGRWCSSAAGPAWPTPTSPSCAAGWPGCSRAPRTATAGSASRAS